jgi:hypothetical protein
MAKGLRDSKREAFWREVLGRQAASGLGVRAFCRQEKLAESAFHWWRRTITRRDAQGRPPKPPAFLPVVVEHHRQQPQDAITIELAGRRVLRLPASMPASRLAEVVQALEAGWAASGVER